MNNELKKQLKDIVANDKPDEDTISEIRSIVRAWNDTQASRASVKEAERTLKAAYEQTPDSDVKEKTRKALLELGVDLKAEEVTPVIEGERDER